MYNFVFLIQDDGDKNDGDYSPKKGAPSKKKAPATKRGRKKKDDSDSDEDWKGGKKGAKKAGGVSILSICYEF